jgi:hypothetical protein
MRRSAASTPLTLAKARTRHKYNELRIVTKGRFVRHLMTIQILDRHPKRIGVLGYGSRLLQAFAAALFARHIKRPVTSLPMQQSPRRGCRRGLCREWVLFGGGARRLDELRQIAAALTQTLAVHRLEFAFGEGMGRGALHQRVAP